MFHRHMSHFFAAAITGLLVALACMSGCKTTVQARPDSQNVEFLYEAQGRVDTDKRCTKLEGFDVVATPDERTESATHTVAQLKAKNRATDLGATHVLVSAEETFECTESGDEFEPDPEAEEQDEPLECSRLQATALECIIGNAPPKM